ncbi:helix-turn-helix transcriptional regulator [Ferrimonas pelagia]|uniref:Helix-turn-helix transcriptional regulator n=1 Tax=Ferrimonas pelagia TaxID=1177826 RepID=A0ABP9F3C3_9GAMM
MTNHVNDLSKKIKAIREADGVSQPVFAEKTGISISSLKKIEAGYTGVGSETLVKLTMHPEYEKYTLWLMTGKVAPEAGQISPDIESVGGIASDQASKAG